MSKSTDIAMPGYHLHFQHWDAMTSERGHQRWLPKLRKNAIFERVPSKIQNFQTEQLVGNFVSVYGSSGWHLVTSEHIKKFKMTFKMDASIREK